VLAGVFGKLVGRKLLSVVQKLLHVHGRCSLSTFIFLPTRRYLHRTSDDYHLSSVPMGKHYDGRRFYFFPALLQSRRPAGITSIANSGWKSVCENLYGHLVRFQTLCISVVVIDVNVRTIASWPRSKNPRTPSIVSPTGAPLASRNAFRLKAPRFERLDQRLGAAIRHLDQSRIGGASNSAR
jgi:hypothetical protein